MTVNSFREELNHITASVIAAIEDYHKTDPSGVVIEHTNLLRHIGQQVLLNGYLVEPNPIHLAAGLGPMFSKIPREIRDSIFEELLASGHPEFLRASKIMNLEGTSLISKYGIYRINIGFGKKANCPKINQKTADTVQNLHLRVDMTQYTSFGGGRYPQGNILEMFSNSDICRKYCNVSFDCCSTTRRLLSMEVLRFLKSFKKFEEVALSINTSGFGGISYPEHMYARIWIEVYKKYRHLSLDFACQALESDLGTAYRVQEGESTQLVFHPCCSGQGKAKDSSGKDKRKWVKWEDEKE